MLVGVDWGGTKIEAIAIADEGELSQPPRRLPVAAPSLPAARAVRTAVRPRRRPESLGHSRFPASAPVPGRRPLGAWKPRLSGSAT
jgi:hypothetical protein